jgi:hypothetical protein
MIDSNYLVVVVVVDQWNDKDNFDRLVVLHWNMVESKYVDEVLFEMDMLYIRYEEEEEKDNDNYLNAKKIENYLNRIDC